MIPGRSTRRPRSTARRRGSGSRRSRCRCCMPALLVALIFRTLDALRIFDLPYVLTKGAHGTNTLSLIALRDVPGEPPLRRGLGAGDPHVHHRDGRLVPLHPLRRRQPPRTGGGVDHGSCIRSRRPASAARTDAPRSDSAEGQGHDPWWMWLAVAGDRDLLPVPVLLAGQHLAEDRARTCRPRRCSRRTRRWRTTSRSSRTTTSRRALNNSAIVALVTTCARRWSWARSARTRWRG